MFELIVSIWYDYIIFWSSDALITVKFTLKGIQMAFFPIH